MATYKDYNKNKITTGPGVPTMSLEDEPDGDESNKPSPTGQTMTKDSTPRPTKESLSP